MSANIRNLDWIKSVKVPGHEDFGARLFEALTDVKSGLGTLEQQTNSNLNGAPDPPPGLQAIKVTPTAVGHHVSISHGAEFYRGIHYHVEYADNSHFTNPFPAYTGPAREIDLATGPRSLFFRAFASYQNSGNTALIYHGGATPKVVPGGISTSLSQQSQGSGTCQPGEGHSGFGNISFRGSKPPTRG